MYMNPIVTTNQKPMIDNKDKKEMNPSKLLKKIIKLHRKKQKEEMNRDELKKNNLKTGFKMQISTYLLIITLNVSGLNSLGKNDIGWLIE